MRSCTFFTIAAACVLVAAWCVLHRRSGEYNTRDVGWKSESVRVSDGVEYRYFAEGSPMVNTSESDALVLDVDLTSHSVRLQVAADSPVRRKGGKVFGISHTVRDWCVMNGAIGGVNGGFFGQTDGDNKQAEGLLAVEGKVYNSGRWIKSTRRPGESFLRCALAIRSDGSPQIGWATCQADGEMLMYDRPLSPARSRSFNVSSAVACGPRLVVNGSEQVSDETERLVSSLALPRTFVAYDYTKELHSGERKPHHFVMGIAMQMNYHEVARFLQSYFRKHHDAECGEAMCLDGGSSSQLVYHAPSHNNHSVTEKAADDWIDARPSRVTVPTALLVLADSK